MSKEKIEQMQKKLKARETELAGLHGEQTQILKQIKEEGCETVGDLEKEIAFENKRVEKLQKQIAKGIDQLEHDYDWT